MASKPADQATGQPIYEAALLPRSTQPGSFLDKVIWPRWASGLKITLVCFLLLEPSPFGQATRPSPSLFTTSPLPTRKTWHYKRTKRGIASCGKKSNKIMKSTFQRRISRQSNKSTPLSRFVGLSYTHPAEPPGQDLRYWIWFALLSTTWSLSVFFKSHQICMLPGFFSSWLHPVGLGSRQPYPLLKCLQHKNKQNKVPWDGPGLASLEVALWVDCTLLTISLTCHLGSHTPQAAFTDIVTKQRKWCFVELVDVQWKWKDENWNRHTSAVQGAALRTGCHDPLWQSIFWTLLNSSPCSQKRLIFCVKNVF